MVEGECDPSSVRMDVMTVASFLAVEREAVCLEGGGQLAGGKRIEAGKIHAHTVTATTGRSEAVTLAGRDSPSSSSASITI